MNNLTEAEYFEFQDFLSSNKDEMEYFSFMFIDAKIKNNCLGKEDIKTLSKKIYIAKNR